jgi:hypothetical protein
MKDDWVEAAPVADLGKQAGGGVDVGVDLSIHPCVSKLGRPTQALRDRQDHLQCLKWLAQGQDTQLCRICPLSVN